MNDFLKKVQAQREAEQSRGTLYVDKPERFLPPKPKDLSPQLSKKFCTVCGMEHERKFAYCLSCELKAESMYKLDRDRVNRQLGASVQATAYAKSAERLRQEERAAKAEMVKRERWAKAGLCFACGNPRQHKSWKICDSKDCEVTLAKIGNKYRPNPEGYTGLAEGGRRPKERGRAARRLQAFNASLESRDGDEK